MANAPNAAANAANVPITYRTQVFYPLRSAAIGALGFQEDARAVPALKRLLNASEVPYEIPTIVSALYKCGGFTIAEQVDAVEDLAKNNEVFIPGANVVANAAYSASNTGFLKQPSSYYPYPVYSNSSTVDVKRVLGAQLAQQFEVKEDLAAE